MTIPTTFRFSKYEEQINSTPIRGGLRPLGMCSASSGLCPLVLLTQSQVSQLTCLQLLALPPAPGITFLLSHTIPRGKIVSIFRSYSENHSRKALPCLSSFGFCNEACLGNSVIAVVTLFSVGCLHVSFPAMLCSSLYCLNLAHCLY